jgi:hypothetical protein
MKDTQFAWKSCYRRLNQLGRIVEGSSNPSLQGFVTLFMFLGCQMSLVQFLHHLRPSTLGGIEVQIVALYSSVLF